MIGRCPLCDLEVEGKFIQRDWFTHFICDQCGTKTLVESEGEPAYPDEYFGGENKKKFGGIAGTARKYWHERRARTVRSLGKGAGCRLYDVGCGDGLFLEACRTLGFEVGGCEPMDKAREQAECHLRCSIHQAAFDKTSAPYDIVTTWQVIEHMDNPIAYFRLVRENLVPGGVFAVSTVNMESWQALIFGSKWLHLDPPRHLWLPKRKELEKTLIKEGFTIMERRWSFMEFGPIGYADSVINLVDPKRDRLLKCLKTGFPGIRNKLVWMLAALLTPFAILLAAGEALFARPSTFEIYAIKSS